MDTVAVIVGYSGIGCQREFEYTAIIGQHCTAGFQNSLFLRSNRRLQGCDLRILIRDGLLIFLNRLFLIADIGFVSDNVPVLLIDQSFHVRLFLLHTGFCLVQDCFLLLQLLLAEFNILTVLHEVFPLLAVICHHQVHEIRPVQEVAEAFCLQHHIHDIGVPSLIHNSYAPDHGIFLIFFLFQCRIQFRLCLSDLLLFGSDLALQFCNILFDFAQILIQLCHIVFQIALLRLQILFDLLQVTQIALHRFPFFLRLADLILFLPDAVRCNGRHACGIYPQTVRCRRSGQYQTQCQAQEAFFLLIQFYLHSL